jgi:hypothetical protein
MRGLALSKGLTAALLVAVLAGAGPAIADQTCSNLEASLASVSNGGDRTKVRRYERAIISQKQQLERAQNRQANAGCSTFLSSIKPHCGEIRATVAKMERNLLSLQRTKNELAGGGATQEKARILAALNENGCRGGTARNGDKRETVTLFGRLFGGPEQPRGEASSGEPERREQTAARRLPPLDRQGESSAPTTASGRYRTLCVRTCDGYFFPIAYSSSPKLFDRDTRACQTMCPGTEVALYRHRVPDEETDEMVSVATGEPYTELAAAFTYRDPDYERPKACQCNPPKDFSIIAGDLPEQSDGETVDVPAPASRPDPAEDPETRANREGGLTPDTMAELLAPQVASDTEPEPRQLTESGGRRVRVVGPRFLPDPEAAIDLRAPGRTELR